MAKGANAPLAVTAPPTVTSVAPMQICSGGSELVVTGTGFRTGATVTVLCDSGVGETHVVDSLASEASGDGTTLSLRFGGGADPAVQLLGVTFVDEDTLTAVVPGGMQPFIDNPEPLGQARAFAGTATVGRYIYVFGGTDGTDALASGERALVLSPVEVPVITDIDLCLDQTTVNADGSLVINLNNPVQDSEPSRPGFTTLVAFDGLFVLGGADPMPRSDASSARVISIDQVSTSFNSEGIQLVEGRYVPGFSVQSAFLFMVGGQTRISSAGGAITGGDVTGSTEYIVW